MRKSFIPGFIGLLVSLVMFGCKSAEYAAQWLENPISIDSDYSDWQGNLTSEKDGKISFGFQRDSSYFYVCMIATDIQVQRQLMIRGLEMHFDPDGEKKQRISIKYPLGLMASGMPMQDMMDSRNRSGIEEAEIIHRFQNSLGDLEIKNSEDETYHPLALAELPGLGLEVSANAETGEWICEMRIPLGSADTFQYALGQSQVSSVEIEMKTPEINPDAMSGQMSGRGGGMRGGGMGGGGSRRSGGMRGGGPQGGRQDMPESIKFSVRVHLMDD
ncbi:hypothetical protein HQ585_00800 [candidate division KSB1 bacterium]|nr:hypothetical protein [candidate division KSB1 bacterium]